MDTPDRREIHEGVKKVKERQAVTVNRHRQNKEGENRKEVLEVDSICTLVLEVNDRNQLNFRPTYNVQILGIDTLV